MLAIDWVPLPRCFEWAGRAPAKGLAAGMLTLLPDCLPLQSQRPGCGVGENFSIISIPLHPARSATFSIMDGVDCLYLVQFLFWSILKFLCSASGVDACNISVWRCAVRFPDFSNLFSVATERSTKESCDRKRGIGNMGQKSCCRKRVTCFGHDFRLCGPRYLVIRK